MLAARITTAALLGTLFVGGTLWAPPWLVGTLVAVAGYIGALEWAALAGIASAAARHAYAALTLTIAVLLCFVPAAVDAHSAVFATATLWWVLAAAWIVSFERSERPAVRARLPLAACGWLAMPPALLAIWQLLAAAPYALLALFALVWSADILAFFAGRRWGRRRLAPHVSPGKTWAGLYGGLVGTTGLAALAAGVLRPGAWLPLVLLAFGTCVLAVVGDLLESLLKRLRGVKDSGTLLPGHGGVLDRVDSILAAAPAFTLGLIAMGYA